MQKATPQTPQAHTRMPHAPLEPLQNATPGTAALIGYQPRHFDLAELVPPEMHRAQSAERLWGLLDARMLWSIDALRDIYGPMVCNTWAAGGEHRYRGLRPHDCSVGAALSDHKFGRAVDIVPVRTTAEAIRADIRDAERRSGENPAFAWISVVETNVSWLHLGFRNHPRDARGILWVEG
ncbi:hypothetical protein dsat_2160 [Alkalidesulfovibrio alkalitolerans DSM 16529]|uniref:Peptidase M15A n=2 Tax=Alkalidesulfovibrio alkalitolerans TaxID=293256 RepID=S7UN78_9BACT|nr:hypothetical protein dsat_2160 [Alkalidesulfovibrio alkalitolerans DSM 16529]